MDHVENIFCADSEKIERKKNYAMLYGPLNNLREKMIDQSPFVDPSIVGESFLNTFKLSS